MPLTIAPRISEELNDFFKTSHTLLIKGDAGTGKTTLALEILRCLEPVDCIYFSTKTPPSILYEYYPWLRDKIVLGPEEIRFLETRQESPDRLLNRLRDQLLKMERPLLIIDTWNAMASEMDHREQLRTAKAIIMTTYVTKGKTILVEETDERSFLDYLVDGVVILIATDVYGEAESGRVYEDRLEKRTAREMELKKLRGIKIVNKKYPFTLEGGRFQSFPPFNEDLSVRPAKITNFTDDRISSGTPELDKITGGFKKGSFNLFEIEHGVDMRYLQIHTQIAWNTIMNKGAVIIVPSIGERYPSELLREVILHHPQTNDFESEIKVIREIVEKKFNSKCLKKGLVIFLGFDTLINRFGSDKTLTIVQAIMNYTEENGTIIIGTMKRGMEFLEYVTHTAESHFVFKDLNNALVIYGMRPKTGLYVIDLIENQVRLVPIV
ncbi:MAG: AAA family ATPase [Candidatus Methylarchaceae archaeon HK02M1]|nr:AAA family ATPase [Candidatus Methylarchaceae archaeon HK01M]MCP8312572.1 AAA family ATPase [Candidatus Methylarchaceae archaeon HK02M1]